MVAMSGTRIDEFAVNYSSSMSRIATLDLSYSRVTEVGMRALLSKPVVLETLRLTRCRISAEAIKAARVAYPNTVIEYEQ